MSNNALINYTRILIFIAVHWILFIRVKKTRLTFSFIPAHDIFLSLN